MARSLLTVVATTLALLGASPLVEAKDPAQGWMSYATANCTGKRITSYEAKWKVSPEPTNPNNAAFYSPWIGMDTTDNLNLLQPVNPWFGSKRQGGKWVAYTEYFEWDNFYNHNSPAINVTAGDVLHGSIVYNGDSQNSYTIVQKNLNTGEQSSQTVPVEKDPSTGNYKDYTVLYVVYEKNMWPCNQYPPTGELTFRDIKVECDGASFSPPWTTSYVDDHCDNRAHVVDPSTIQITWDTKAESKYTEDEAIAFHGKPTWGKKKV